MSDTERATTTEPAGAPPDRRRYLGVAEEVLRAVAVGAIVPGDRLPDERRLAERCGVSRSTVREALLALELGGVVAVRPGAGCYLTGMGVQARPAVSLPIDSSPRELLGARQMIEPSVAHLAARSLTHADLTRLRELVDAAAELRDGSSQETVDRSVTLSLAFHRELALGCGNSILASITAQLVDAGEHPLWLLVDGLAGRDEAVRARQVDEHRAILDAVAKGDAVTAVDAMAAHLGSLSSRIFGAGVTKRSVSRARRRRRA